MVHCGASTWAVGLRLFAELGLILFAAVNVAHLFANDLHSAIIVRVVMGFAAAPLSTLAFVYVLEPLPPARKLTLGVCFGMMWPQLSIPISRLVSPHLLDFGQWHGLALFETGLAFVSLAIVFLLPITHPPRAKVFDRVDIVSFPLLASGFDLISRSASRSIRGRRSRAGSRPACRSSSASTSRARPARRRLRRL